MSIINQKYENNVDYVWYNSSNIYYSECYDKPFELKELKVVFKNGAAYLYKDVDVQDYIMFKNGGTEQSQGKAFIKFIKNKNYKFEKLENENIQLLEENRKKIFHRIYFVSGHRQITEEEFNNNYVPALTKAANDQQLSFFIMGDYSGVDIMAQNYLLDVLGISPERVTVFHMFTEARNINSKVVNTSGGYKNDEERDAAMTNASTDDIAFVRDHTKLSGTGQNLLRRHLLKRKKEIE